MRDDVDAVGGVWHEDEVIGRDAEKRAQRPACLRKQAIQPPPQELDRLLLQCPLPALIRGENGTRTGAEATVVEKGDSGAQQELRASARHGRIRTLMLC